MTEGASMTDIHSHIVFSVDDGAVDLDQTHEMLVEAAESGVKTIFATPHFADVILDPKRVVANMDETRRLADGMGIKILEGCEIYLELLLMDKIHLLRRFTYTNSRYLLCEFPFTGTSFSERKNLELLDNIRFSGLKPIIAHPERTPYFMKKPRRLAGLLDKGYLIQVNAGSILGIYGTKTKSLAIKMINDEMVDFVASDAHRPGQYRHFARAYDKVAQLKGINYADAIFKINQEILLAQKDLSGPVTKGE